MATCSRPSSCPCLSRSEDARIEAAGVGWSGACARGLLRSRVLPDACNYCESGCMSVNMTRRGLIVAWRDLYITSFSFKLLNFSVTEEVTYTNERLLH